jgi:hypothetical protein
MGRRSIVLVAAGVALAVAAVALWTSMRGEYRAPPGGAAATTIDATRVAVVSPDAAAPPALDATAPPPDALVSDAPSPAAEERDAAVATIRGSGPAHEVWDDQATDIFAAVVAGAGEIVDSGCYIAGCAATLSFSSRAAYERALEALEASDRYRAWTGGKRITAPEIREDGSVIVALILSRPD